MILLALAVLALGALAICIALPGLLVQCLARAVLRIWFRD